MLAFFVFAALAALVSIHRPEWITAAWVAPLAIFAVSVLAAVACRPRLRRDPALLGLHLGLLVLILLIGVARLTYLDGAVTLTEGSAFEGVLHVDARGPLHPDGLGRLRFANEGLVEDFADRYRWKATYNRVRWWDEAGASHVAEIGDDSPLLLNGYRIYTTFNRGYSPVFLWEPIGAEPELGTVQLLPDDEFGMANGWQLPNGPEVWVMLDPLQPIVLQRGEQRENMDANRLPHQLVVRLGGQRREILERGGSLELPGGRLTYLELKTWMGYRIVYDFAVHWMASTAAVIVICLIAFYARLIRRPDEGVREYEAASRRKQCA